MASSPRSILPWLAVALLAGTALFLLSSRKDRDDERQRAEIPTAAVQPPLPDPGADVSERAGGPIAASSDEASKPDAEEVWEPVSSAPKGSSTDRVGVWMTDPDASGRRLRATLVRDAGLGRIVQTTETLQASDGRVLERSEYVAGRVLAKLAPGTDEARLRESAEAAGATLGRRVGGQGWYEVIGSPTDPGSVGSLLRALGGPDSPAIDAEPDFIVRALATPNDPRYLDGSLYGLNNTGQNGGTSDADIDAPEAWDVRREAPGIIVAVIDTGINTDHEDLADNLWVNAGEIAGDGIDNDANGYIDDVHGINAITGSGDPADDHGHGSHCAGTVGGRGDNGKGIAGVAWNVKLMGLKFLSASGSGAGSDAIESIEYARSMGAHVLSNSWGGGSFSSALRDTIVASRNAGQIFVAAAANNAANNDVAPVYPASYDVDNIVAIAASTRSDALASYSNFGQGLVHIAAPGSEILSASHSDNSGYVTMSGTSMATPHVSGMLALIKAQYPTDTYAASINRLLNSADAKAALAGKVSTGGRANLNAALTTAAPTPFNDAFAKLATITGSSVNVRASNHLATAEAGEPVHAGIASATTTLWYSWVAPSTGNFILNTQNSLIDTVAAIYTGSAVNALTPVAANDDHLANSYSRVEFSAAIGTTYRIAIAGKNAAQGLIRFTLSGPPGEDNLVNAINLPEFPAFGSGSNVNATKEPGEPDHAGAPGGASVWAKWTATITGPVVAHTVGSAIDTLFAVYSGPASSPTFGTLSLVAQNDDDTPSGLTTSLVRFHATAGVTYYFATDGKSGAQGGVNLAIFPELTNDAFASRTALSGSTLSITLPDTRYATREAGEPDHGGHGGLRSVWYAWTAPATGAYQIDTAGSNALVSLTAYTGSAIGTLAPVASGYLNGGFGNSRILLDATAGTLYILAIDNPDAQFGPGKLNITPVVLAPNNDFSAATAILGTPTLGNPVVVTGSNTGASQEPGEPDAAADTVLTSVWWSWTATATERFTLATEGSDFDTVLGVYTGAAVNALSEIAEDDDGGDAYTSRLSFDAIAGVTYHIRVYGYGGQTGNISLKLETWQPVANDSFATPVVFNGTTYRHLTYTDEATAEAGEPAHAGTAAVRSVWFSHTATTDGPLTLSTDGSSFSTRVAVYTGAAVNTLTPVASNDNYHSLTTLGQVTWNGIAGTTYRIAVDGDSGSSGSLRTTFVIGPSNDAFANRTVIGSVSSYSETTYNHGATKEGGEPGFIASRWTGKTLWWSWTAPSTGQFEVTTEGSMRQFANSNTPATLDTVLGVYTGTAFPLTAVGNNDDVDLTKGILTSRVIVNAVAGTTYQITVAGGTYGSTEDWLKQAAQGEVKLTVRPFQKAANDNLAQAITVGASLPAFFETSNLGLGIQTGEPGTANSPTDPNYDTARSKGTAWWKWTAPTTARYHAATGGLYETDNAENTILSVYSGPASAPTFGALSLIAWDTDSAGAGYSLVSFNATAGQTYYFQAGSETRGKLHFLLAPTPANDHFAAATLLHGASVTTTGHNLGATFETSEPNIDEGFLPKYTGTPPSARSVWWRWTAPATGSVSVDTLGSGIFSVMAIYTGSSLGSLNQIVKSDWTGRDPYNGEQPRGGCAQVSFAATAGQTYFIQVEGGFSDNPSAGLIALKVEQPASPSGDPFVTVAALPDTATEGGAPGTLIISRTTAPPTPLTVSLAASGTAINGTDYVALPSSVIIPANAYSAELTVNAIADGLLESGAPETVTLTVQPGAGYQVASVASATVGIVDPTSFASTAPVLTVAATGSNTLGLTWSFPPADHTHWRLQTAPPVPASRILYEGFNYAAGTALIGSGSWIEGTGTGTAATIADANLSQAGFAEPTGRMVALGNRGARRPFTGGVTDLHISFLLRFDDVTAMSTSWNTLLRTENGSTNGLGLFVRRSAIGAYDLGLHKRANGGAVETSSAVQNLTSGTTYLIVVRYRTVAGTGNDAMELWVNPASSSFGSNAAIPAPAFTSIAGSDTAVVWNTFALLPPANASGAFDELRIGSDWAAVTQTSWDAGTLLPASDSGVTVTGLAPSTSTGYRLRAESGANVSAWSNIVSPTTAATANPTDWLAAHFATAFPEGDAAWTADPDADGSANLMEYAFGTTPTQAASRTLPAVGTTTDHLTLSFTPTQVSGLRYVVEASSALSDWSDTTDITAFLTPGQPYVHTDSANLAITPRRFLRLRIGLEQ